ncbi:MAG: DNA replication and repair protein RecF [Eubacteriaceae bacterium]|nr:DNA replication and repair protein RecF [Eubacteriaceae bacterium]
MRVTRLWIKDFRNIENVVLEFGDKLNIFTGKNGSGKTNTIEALRMSLSLKSHRENKNVNFIRHSCSRADVKAEIVFDDLTTATSHLAILPNKKSVKFDGQENMKKNTLRLNCPVIFFAPEDLDLIKGGPSVRRDFIDEAVSFLSPRYAKELKEYYEILRQKSFLLKNYRESDKGLLELYNEALAKCGSSIVRHRIKFLREFDEYLISLHRSLSGSDDICLNYISNIYDDASSALTEEIYLLKLSERSREEILSRQCLLGIHKDDIAVILSGRNSRSFASQGQQRTLAICMKLGMIGFYKEKTDQKAIVMLDDVMSELDSQRRSQLIEILSDTQTFITATEDNFSHDAAEKKIFSVSDGIITTIADNRP